MRLVVCGLVLLPVLLGAACNDDPNPGTTSACDQPVGPLLGCPPPVASPDGLSIEDACLRLVSCGAGFLDNGENGGDYLGCVNVLRGDEFTAERLDYLLRCVEVSTCQDIREGHCVRFGGDPP